MTTAEKPIATPWPQRVEDFKRRTLPFLVWGVAALVSVLLLFQRTQQFEYLGVARAQQYEISASTRGILQAVPVDLYEDTEAGDVVARLDDSVLRASVATSQSNVERLRAELQAAQIRATADGANLSGELRRFQIDEEDRRLEVLDLKVTIESDKIEAERLTLELERSRPLVPAGFMSQNELDSLQLLHRQATERVRGNEALLKQTEAEYRAAQARRQRYESELPNLPAEARLLEPLIAAINVESRRIDEIELQRKALVLRSPISGQVSQMLCTVGQAVVPGEPILTIADRSSREIVAYLDDRSDAEARLNRRVAISRRSNPAAVAESLVVRLGPVVETLPQRLWRDPRVPDHGRAVIIAGVPALGLVPGELVNVRFLSD